ncbi:hypothetical protein QBC38DRAFT_450184 [Podospora fimiseda]|uniref:Uncharacterized protein n=1 Tax=Podospora fimiseda TaxID=252190 RepID=A0AAN7BZX6_9PEZI|nr:hypothetical protein QBC38DRAFT_450184 [Podospora fimiseda]
MTAVTLSNGSWSGVDVKTGSLPTNGSVLGQNPGGVGITNPVRLGVIAGAVIGFVLGLGMIMGILGWYLVVRKRRDGATAGQGRKGGVREMLTKGIGRRRKMMLDGPQELEGGGLKAAPRVELDASSSQRRLCSELDAIGTEVGGRRGS